MENVPIPLQFRALVDKDLVLARVAEYPLTVRERKGAEIRAVKYFSTALFTETGNYAAAALFSRS